jgi:hypothetical protein
MANTFSPAELCEIKVKVSTMWKDAQVMNQYKANVTGLTAIRANQTARITPLESNEKDYKVSVKWITTGNLVVSNAGPNCELEEPELAAASKSYALDSFRSTGFSLNEDDLKSTIYSKEEVVAQATLAALKILDEDVARICMAKADGFIGTNAFTGGRTVTNGKVQLAANLTPQQRYAYLAKARILNKGNASYLIDNGTTFEEFQIAQYNAGNNDGKGVVTAFGDLPMYFDMFNMAAAGLTTDALLIDRGALAFASRTKFTATPAEPGGEILQTRYTVKSPNLPGVEYDVYYTLKCVPNDNGVDEDTLHIWRFVARFGLFLNPTDGSGKTGVLGFDIV